MQHQWNIYQEKRACWCLWKALPNRQFLARKRHWWQCAKQKQIGPRSEGGRVIGRETPASSFPMAFGGRREIASRSSSIQESGFSFLNLCKGSQIQGIGVLHFLISSVQRNGIPSSQTMFALFYSQFGDRGAFSPWGKLFCYSPRVHPGGHSLLLAPLQTQHLIWIGVLAISYWLSKKLTISNGGWFEIWRGKQDFPITQCLENGSFPQKISQNNKRSSGNRKFLNFPIQKYFSHSPLDNRSYADRFPHNFIWKNYTICLPAHSLWEFPTQLGQVTWEKYVLYMRFYKYITWFPLPFRKIK